MSSRLNIKKVSLKKFNHTLNLVESDEKESVFKITKEDTGVDFQLGAEIVRLYNEDYRIQYYLSDGSVCFHNENSTSILETFKFTSEPNIVPLRNKGEDAFLAFNQESAFFSNAEESFSLNCYPVYETVKERLYQANGREVYVSEGFNVLTGNHDFCYRICYNTERADGKVLGIVDFEGNILLGCEHKLVMLSFSQQPDSVVVKRLTTPHFIMREDSFKLCGDKAVFLSEGKICLYSSKGFSSVSLPKSVQWEEIYTHCSCKGALYVIPFIRDGEKYLCVYDTEKDKFAEIKTQAIGLSKKGALFFEDGIIYSLATEEYIENSISKNGFDTDLDFCGAKVLYEIQLHAEGNGVLTVMGDFGLKSFNISSGCNKLYCNLYSKKFTFAFSEKSADFYATQAQLVYSKIGG